MSKNFDPVVLADSIEKARVYELDSSEKDVIESVLNELGGSILWRV